MEKIKYIVVAGAVLAAGIIVFVIFSQSEEAKVKKQFSILAEKMKKTEKETPFVAAARAKKNKRTVCRYMHRSCPCLLVLKRYFIPGPASPGPYHKIPVFGNIFGIL